MSKPTPKIVINSGIKNRIRTSRLYLNCNTFGGRQDATCRLTFCRSEKDVRILELVFFFSVIRATEDDSSSKEKCLIRLDIFNGRGAISSHLQAQVVRLSN